MKGVTLVQPESHNQEARSPAAGRKFARIEAI